MEFRIRLPGSTANLGPGYDALGMALSIYNYVAVKIRSQPGLSFRIEGEGKGILPADEVNLFYRAAQFTAQRAEKILPGIDIHMHNTVPLARGLGSSSTAIVGGVIAANCLLGEPFSQMEMLDIATAIEGHPDNVSPCLLGGFTASTMNDNRVACVRALPPKELRAVVAIPEFELKTEDARNVLPNTISHRDAVFSTSRACIVTAALITGNFEHLAVGMQDRLHHPYRAKLIPGFDQILAEAVNAGAWGAALSGAGPTLVALTTQNADAIGQAMIGIWAKKNIRARYQILKVDPSGATVT
ncbi:MAG: homoserine kinase [Candidatus Latescibacteria bacterium]|nr:homoserine kinase [Candidatus Latescibacterota bacterium]